VLPFRPFHELLDGQRMDFPIAKLHAHEPRVLQKGIAPLGLRGCQSPRCSFGAVAHDISDMICMWSENWLFESTSTAGVRAPPTWLETLDLPTRCAHQARTSGPQDNPGPSFWSDETWQSAVGIGRSWLGICRIRTFAREFLVAAIHEDSLQQALERSFERGGEGVRGAGRRGQSECPSRHQSAPQPDAGDPQPIAAATGPQTEPRVDRGDQGKKAPDRPTKKHPW